MLLSVLAATAACEPEAPEPEVPIELSGVFVADADDGAGISEIELGDGRYRLLADGCTQAQCLEEGRFEIVEARHVIRLDPDGVREPHEMDFEILDATDHGGDDAADEELVPDDGADEGASDGAGEGVNEAAETSDALRLQNLYKPTKLQLRRARLVRRARLLRRNYTRQQGNCTQSQIAVEQRICRAQCSLQGRNSRGINFCSASSSGYVWSTCQCGSSRPATSPCDACRSSFSRCMANAGANNCYIEAANCRGRFYSCPGASADCAKPPESGACRGM